MDESIVYAQPNAQVTYYQTTTAIHLAVILQQQYPGGMWYCHLLVCKTGSYRLKVGLYYFFVAVTLYGMKMKTLCILWVLLIVGNASWFSSFHWFTAFCICINLYCFTEISVYAGPGNIPRYVRLDADTLAFVFQKKLVTWGQVVSFS